MRPGVLESLRDGKKSPKSPDETSSGAKASNAPQKVFVPVRLFVLCHKRAVKAITRNHMGIT